MLYHQGEDQSIKGTIIEQQLPAMNASVKIERQNMVMVFEDDAAELAAISYETSLFQFGIFSVKDTHSSLQVLVDELEKKALELSGRMAALNQTQPAV